LRLIYLANARIPTEKAHGLQIVKMCEAFASQGLSVELLHPARHDPGPMGQVKDIWEYYGLQRNFSRKSFPCLDLQAALFYRRIGGTAAYLAFWLQTLTYALALMPYLACQNADVYYTRDLALASLLSVVKRSQRLRIFYEAHTLPPSGLAQGLVAWVARRIGGVVVLTRGLKEAYESLAIPAKAFVVAPDGVALNRFRLESGMEEARRLLDLPLERKIIGYVGRFHTMGMDKGLGLLVRAAGKLQKYGVWDLALCFVGGPLEMATQYRVLAEEADLGNDSLILVDQVPMAQIPYYLQAFDICAMPFPWTEHFAYFASPIKLFEYMASGRPIVATDLPAIREILRDGDNAILVPPGDVEALAQGIQRVLQDQDLAVRLARQAFLDVQQYTWSKRAEKIMAIFKHDTGDSDTGKEES
jgi:glycosyltransferase involved in cell wall biosynthesis